MNGRLVSQAEAVVPFLTAGLHYGMGVFEGIRCDDTSDGPAIFRLRDHVSRLVASARALGFRDLPYGLPRSSPCARWTSIQSVTVRQVL